MAFNTTWRNQLFIAPIVFLVTVAICRQVNTQACEVLYSKVAEVLAVDTTTVLADVCCGTGTIGLSLAEVR